MKSAGKTREGSKKKRLPVFLQQPLSCFPDGCPDETSPERIPGPASSLNRRCFSRLSFYPRQVVGDDFLTSLFANSGQLEGGRGNDQIKPHEREKHGYQHDRYFRSELHDFTSFIDSSC